MNVTVVFFYVLRYIVVTKEAIACTKLCKLHKCYHTSHFFMCLFRTPTMIRGMLNMYETGVSISPGNKIPTLLSYPVGSRINNGNWHYMALTLDDNMATLYLDGMTADAKNFTAQRPS